MSLNHDLLKYGPEANDITSLLREYVVSKIAETWRHGGAGHKPGLPDPPPSQLLENVEDKLLSLAPRSESQRLMVTRALKITDDLTMTSWVQTAQAANDIPHPFIFDSDVVAMRLVHQLWSLRTSQCDRCPGIAGLRSLNRQRRCHDCGYGPPI